MNEKTISQDNWLALKRLNEIQQKQLEKARKENEDLKSQIEILKKFSLIGEIIKWNSEFIQSEIKK